jgi:hypothetical protein
VKVQLAGPIPCDVKVAGCPIPDEHDAPLPAIDGTRLGVGSKASGKLTEGKVRSMVTV